MMRSYIVYIPDDNAWIEVFDAMQVLGKVYSDHENLVVLSSEHPVQDVERQLRGSLPNLNFLLVEAAYGGVAYRGDGTISNLAEVLDDPLHPRKL